MSDKKEQTKQSNIGALNNAILDELYKNLHALNETTSVDVIDSEARKFLDPNSAYSDLMKSMKESFSEEELFIKKRRKGYSLLIFILIIVSFVLIVAITVLAFVFNLNMGVYISAFVTLVVESLGLLKILFDYLFNRKDNKVLEIISDTLKNYGEYWTKNDKI